MSAHDKTIVVVRHAKAEQAGPTDFERELAPRGRDDARAAGSWLAGQGIDPDAALVSAATRTRQTWSHLAQAADWAVEPSLDRGLYAAGSDTLVDLLRGLDEAVGCVVVVGHNPTMAYLATVLDDGEGEAEVAAELSRGYPTSACSVFTYAGDWADLEVARLSAYHVGRG